MKPSKKRMDDLYKKFIPAIEAFKNKTPQKAILMESEEHWKLNMNKKQQEQMIKTQADFIKRETFVLNLLKFYFKHTKDFNLIFSDTLKKEMMYDISNPEHICEFLEELGHAIEYGFYIKDRKQYIKLEGNGIFSVFNVSKRKDLTIDEALKYSDFSNFKGW